jgi:hypothetical protein
VDLDEARSYEGGARVRARNGIGESRTKRYHVLEDPTELDARPVLDGVDAERGTGEDLGCLGSRVGV